MSEENITIEKKPKENMFSPRNIAKMAIFVAISFLLSKLEFPIFPATPFLKLDFSNVFVLIGGFMLGPIPGFIILFCKEALGLLFTSSWVGQLANLLVGSVFVLIPTIVYHFKKGIKVVIITLLIASVVEIGVALLCNRYINFPLYMGEKAEEYFNGAFWFIVIFNAIKSVSVSILTILLYKRVKWVLRF